MRAILLCPDAGSLEGTNQVPRPHAKENGTVVVQTKSCGICATDYQAVLRIERCET